MLAGLGATELFQHPLKSLPRNLLVVLSPSNVIATATKKNSRNFIIGDVDVLQDDQEIGIRWRQEKVLRDSIKGGPAFQREYLREFIPRLISEHSLQGWQVDSSLWNIGDQIHKMLDRR